MHFIRKRSGDVVAFDSTKISNAIRGAWSEVHDFVDDTLVTRITRDVVDSLGAASSVDVERVQDAVEVALMRAQEFVVARAYILFREERAKARSQREPDPTGVSDYIHVGKYSRFRRDLGRRETYLETVARTEAMHVRRFPELEDDIRWAFDLVREKRVLPSMRSLQFGGEAIEANHNRGYNCAATLIDRPRAFAEALYLLLCGCGVGYSVQYRHVDKLPPIARLPEHPLVVHHVIEDTIEGWADALHALICGAIAGRHVELAYHEIRERGAELKTSGGRAPGHIPLRTALERIRGILLGAQGRQLRPIECHRILCHAADAVLAGGIRRSAMIALFSLEDGEMMYCKAEEGWWNREPWLRRANNSVVLKRDEVREEQFRRIFRMTRNFGEPGFHFVSDWDHACNPCVPAGTRILTRDGYRAIETLVGTQVPVWNGKSWSEVSPRITGYDQPMLRVHLSDGTHLDCTDAHQWVVMQGTRSQTATEARVRADALSPGDSLVRFDMPIVETGASLADAYTHGFWCGDGHTEDGRKVAWLYGVKKQLSDRLTCSLDRDQPRQDRVRAVLPHTMPDKFTVPLHADVRSRLEWFAGLLDADGTVVRNPGSLSLQVSSVNEQFLLDTRLMLTTLGVQAKVTQMVLATARVMPDGNGGKKAYDCAPAWRLLVSAADAHHLVTLGLRTSRLNLTLAEHAPQRDARRFVRVERVERLAPADIVYCFTENQNHTGTFEGIVTGQCNEAGLDPVLVLDDGSRLTGWSFCNLCEINAAAFRTSEDFFTAARAATIIGTLQASYTDMPYLGSVTEAITRRDALLGIGMTGVQDAAEIALDPDLQRDVARQVRAWNAHFAARIGINAAARTTLLKPSGTTTLELMCERTPALGSGIHRHHHDRFIRRVEASELEAPFKHFRKTNPKMCVQRPDAAWLIEFPVKVMPGARLRDDQSAIAFLSEVRSTQQNWVAAGTARDSARPGLTHNVSNTVSVRPHEWDEVADYVWEHRGDFAGVSFLPHDGDVVYAFAPFEAVRTPEQERRWQELVDAYSPVDYTEMRETADFTDLSGEAACGAGGCER